MKKKEKLTPVDYKQCQAEKRIGSFMSLGRPELVRCKNKPTWIATEKTANHVDGRKGSMSLCDTCKDAMINRLGPNYAVLNQIATGVVD